jgi:hypothetical protein
MIQLPGNLKAKLDALRKQGTTASKVDPVRAGGTVHTGFDDGAERTLSDGTVNEGTL